MTAIAGYSQVTLQFSPPLQYAEGVLYPEWRRRVESGLWSAWQSVTTKGALEIVVTGLSVGVTYTFQVRPQSLLGPGVVSNTIRIMPLGVIPRQKGIPSAYQGLTATAGDAEVTLKFSPPLQYMDDVLYPEWRRRRVGSGLWSAWQEENAPGTLEIVSFGLVNGAGIQFSSQAAKSVRPRASIKYH